MGTTTIDERVYQRAKWQRVKQAHEQALRGGPLVSKCRGLHVGPHNACRHATADPVGTRRCAADPGCEVFISTRSYARVCSFHADHGVVRQEIFRDRLAALMAAREG